MRGGRIGGPFCYQTLDALNRLRVAFRGPRRATALSIYTTLTELANEREPEDPRRRGFRAERRLVADLAGTTVKTLSGYLPELEAAGLIVVDRSDGEAHHWSLVEGPWGAQGPVTSGYGSISYPGSEVTGPVTSGNGSPSRVASPSAQLQETVNGKEERRNPSRSPERVAGRKVTDAEHDLCDAVLAAWNAVNDTAYEAAYRTPVVMRLREHPEVDLARHEAIIATAFDDPWWNDDAPQPSVVYGNPAVFEAALNRQAVAARKPRPRTARDYRDAFKP